MKNLKANALKVTIAGVYEELFCTELLATNFSRPNNYLRNISQMITFNIVCCVLVWFSFSLCAFYVHMCIFVCLLVLIVTFSFLFFNLLETCCQDFCGVCWLL